MAIRLIHGHARSTGVMQQLRVRGVCLTNEKTLSMLKGLDQTSGKSSDLFSLTWGGGSEGPVHLCGVPCT